MERIKMVKKIAFGLVCLSVLALIGLSVFQYQQFKKLSNGKVSGSVANNETGNIGSKAGGTGQINAGGNTSIAGQSKARNANDVNDLKDQLDTTEKELDTANNKLSDEMARKAELKQKQLALQKQFMNDPSLKKYIRASLDTQYGDLFKGLNLSSEKLEKFKDILVDSASGMSQLSPEIQSATTKEEKADIQRRYDAVIAAGESKIKELLGNADYEKYQEYHEKTSARYYVDGFKESLSSDTQLTDNQEQALTEIMYQEEKKVYSEIGYDPKKTIEFPSDINAGKIAGILKNSEKIQLNSIESAKSTLSAAQLEQFKTYLKNRREIMEMSYKVYNQ